MELLRVAIIISLLEDRFNKNKKDFLYEMGRFKYTK